MRQLRALSPGETAILELVREGDTNLEIARKRGSSPNTVKTQVESILRKLGAHNRTQAVLYAGQEGLLDEHHHAFLAEWRCEHDPTAEMWDVVADGATWSVAVEVKHLLPCGRGRWLYICGCGESGYAIPTARSTDVRSSLVVERKETV